MTDNEDQHRPVGDEDEGVITLPADTMEILQAFLREQADREKAMSEAISGSVEPDIGNGVVSATPKFHAFQENWQLSQFWYNNRTKQLLANVCELLKQHQSPANLNIALLSCPSLYDSIRAVNGVNEGNVHLFEYDQRFVAYGEDFIHFDYNLGNDPAYLSHFGGLYDLVIVDPPFLAEECIEKMSQIVRRLCKPEMAKVILCSGQVVEKWADQHMHLKRCDFEPQHERNLGNEFASYANFDLDAFIRKCSPVDE